MDGSQHSDDPLDVGWRDKPPTLGSVVKMIKRQAAVVLACVAASILIAFVYIVFAEQTYTAAMSAYDAYRDYDPLSAAQKHALANLLHFEESRPDFVSWKVADLPSAAPFLCSKALGLPLMSWTVRTPEDRARAAAHADQMVFEGFLP